MERIECSETSALKAQTPGDYPKNTIRQSTLGESLKLSISLAHQTDWHWIIFKFIDCDNNNNNNNNNWRRILFKNVKGPYLISKFLVFYESRVFITVFTKSRLFFLFWRSRMFSGSLYSFCKIHFNIMHEASSFLHLFPPEHCTHISSFRHLPHARFLIWDPIVRLHTFTFSVSLLLLSACSYEECLTWRTLEILENGDWDSMNEDDRR